jgi:hypothetical protein
MGNLAIVAIPREDEVVWKISSEKVPHLTLLTLGDNVNDPAIPSMASFLEHVAKTSLTRFGLDVDRRGELGDNKADVLFFNKRTSDFLLPIRSFLLGNRDIFRNFTSTPQFPEWTPHLTLGFPETPAKPDNRDWPGISWVNFDRVALWTGDFEGPTFLLKDQLDEEVRMSDAPTFGEVLEHFGIKGMKWGVRRTRAQIDAGASEDHKNAKAAREKARKGGGTKALTNQELQALITRANLETQYSKIAPSKFDKGKRVVSGILSTGKTVNDVISFVNSPAGKVVRDQFLKGASIVKK